MTASGEVSWEIVLGAVWHVVVTVMHSKDWSRSFSSVGITDEQGIYPHGRDETCKWRRVLPYKCANIFRNTLVFDRFSKGGYRSYS